MPLRLLYARAANKSEAIFLTRTCRALGFGSASAVLARLSSIPDRLKATAHCARRGDCTEDRRRAQIAGRLHARVKLGDDPAGDKADAEVRAAETFKTAADTYLDFQALPLSDPKASAGQTTD